MNTGRLWVQHPKLLLALRYAEQVAAGDGYCTAIRHAAALFLAEIEDPAAHGVAWSTDELDWIDQRAGVLGIELMPWQWFAAAVFVARRRAADGLPATRSLLMSVARGAGKTGLAQVLVDCVMARGQDALVCVMSTSQAKSNELHDRLQKSHHGRPAWHFSGGGDRAIGRATYQRAEMKCFPNKRGHFDTIVPAFIYLDEAARMPEGVGRAMSAASKKPGCQVLITTTPDKDQHQREVWGFWEPMQRAVANGDPFPPGWWLLEYSMDPGDTPDTEAAVRKANPSAGVLTDIQTSIDQIRAALNSGKPELVEEAYTQNLATFHQAGGTAIPLEVIDRCSRPIQEAEWGQHECMVAVDFSQGGECIANSQCDLTSMACMAWNGKQVLHEAWHWWAGGSVESDERRTGMPLREWADKGHLTLCAGPTLDYALLEARLLDLHRRRVVRGIVADPAGKATAWASAMERKHGWQWYRAPQTIVWMGSAYGVAREWLLSGTLALQPCPVLRKAVGSMSLYTGLTGLAMPVKKQSRANIDPFTALIMGCKTLNEIAVLYESAYTKGNVVV